MAVFGSLFFFPKPHFKQTLCSGYRPGSSCAKMSYLYKMFLLQLLLFFSLLWSKKFVLLWNEYPLLCSIKEFFKWQIMYVHTQKREGGSHFGPSKLWSVLKCWHFLWEIIPGEGNRSWSSDNDHSRRYSSSPTWAFPCCWHTIKQKKKNTHADSHRRYYILSSEKL